MRFSFRNSYDRFIANLNVHEVIIMLLYIPIRVRSSCINLSTLVVR
jgi:hypothetical protein